MRPSGRGRHSIASVQLHFHPSVWAAGPGPTPGIRKTPLDMSTLPVDWSKRGERLAAMRESVYSLERRLARPDHEWLNEREIRAHSSGSGTRRQGPLTWSGEPTVEASLRSIAKARRAVSSVQQLQHLRDGDFEPKTLRLRGGSTAPDPEPEPGTKTETEAGSAGDVSGTGLGVEEGRDAIRLATPRRGSDDGGGGLVQSSVVAAADVGSAQGQQAPSPSQPTIEATPVSFEQMDANHDGVVRRDRFLHCTSGCCRHAAVTM
jgi:hypothetical protein